MRFEISHTVRYTYSAPVFIEPVTVRLRPRCNSLQQLKHYKLEVEPPPAGSSENLDLYSNNTTTLWFDGMHDHLAFRAGSVVSVPDINPFDFIITGEGVLRLPVNYPDGYLQALEPFSRQRFRSLLVDDYVRPVLARSGGETTSFLLDLTVDMFQKFSKDSRETGGPLPPEDTLGRRGGACRDLALLFVECCRSLGLAARFVSGYGYKENPASQEKRHMHAWAEVYLPGGGWRGFDPSVGQAVSGEHVAVAAGADPEDAAPTCGTFRGTDVRSKLEYDISIKCQI